MQDSMSAAWFSNYREDARVYLEHKRVRKPVAG